MGNSKPSVSEERKQLKERICDFLCVAKVAGGQRPKWFRVKRHCVEKQNAVC